jgi:hypothetical protein
VRRPEGVNGSQSDSASKHWKWTLHFNWDESNAQTNNTSANEWSHYYKMLLILTWDQQNKTITNRTTKSLKRSKTISRTSVVSAIRNYVLVSKTESNELQLSILHTPKQICFQGIHTFWAQSNLWMNRGFKNTAMNWGFLEWVQT